MTWAGATPSVAPGCRRRSRGRSCSSSRRRRRSCRARPSTSTAARRCRPSSRRSRERRPAAASPRHAAQAAQRGDPDGRRGVLRAGLDAAHRRVPPDHPVLQYGGRGRPGDGRPGHRRRGPRVRARAVRRRRTRPPERRDPARRAARRAARRHRRPDRRGAGMSTPRAAYGATTAAAERVNAGVLMAEALRREGVTHLFGLGGGHINPTWWAAPGAGITLIDVRHEAAAAHAAEGWALATGDAGACIVTAGPGLTNALTGLANALNNGSPMVCLAGSATLRGQDTGEVEMIDQLSIAAPVTKWARRVYHADRIPEY